MGELATGIHLFGGIETIMRGNPIVPAHKVVGAGNVMCACGGAMVSQMRGMTVARYAVSRDAASRMPGKRMPGVNCMTTM
jgi:hypothetical protein